MKKGENQMGSLKIENNGSENNNITLKDVTLATIIRESYKTLRTNLLYTEDIKTIAITSSLPDEGKSVTAYHLAVSFAKTGKKTLLIDCDLRKSKLCEYLQISKDIPGISEYLSKQNLKLIHETSFPNLSLIVSGKQPPNPSELLTSERFSFLLHQLREQYDYVIIDTPPLANAVDASIIGRYADGVVLVIRSDYVKRKIVEKSKRLLLRNGGKIVGVVLNRLDKMQTAYEGYYGVYE